MKFGKNLMQVVELSDPEWGPFWINYKLLKKKINDIVQERSGIKVSLQQNNPQVLSNSIKEVEFFRALKKELKKASEFFSSSEKIYQIRHERVLEGYVKLQEDGQRYDKNIWSRLLRACVRLYKDVLLLENFAIMNYCGFSKILKKHDKLTGFVTREAFMRNVMSVQNFTQYPNLLELLKKCEVLFDEIQKMDSVMPLQEEERLFIDAIRDLNYQASQLQAEENETSPSISDGSDGDIHISRTPNQPRSGSISSVPEESQIEASKASKALHDFTASAKYRLDSAADRVTRAASRVSHAETDLRSALAWMQATQRQPTPDGLPTKRRGDSVDLPKKESGEGLADTATLHGTHEGETDLNQKRSFEASEDVHDVVDSQNKRLRLVEESISV